MAAFSYLRVVVDDPAVMSYIQKGGDVNTLLTELAADAKRRMYTILIGGHHFRSGRLIGGLNWKSAEGTGPLTAKSRISSGAKHTGYFMSDTGPLITPKNKWGYLLVPRYNKKQPHMSPATKGAGSELYMAWVAAKKPQARPFKRRPSVRGYDGIPFMERAKDAAFLSRGLMLR